MTPQVKLPIAISCWKPPTYPNLLNRFGPAKYASIKPNMMETGKDFNELNTETLAEIEQAYKRELQMVYNVYAEVQDYEKELSRERNQTSLQALQQLSIPVQPRKHLVLQDIPVIIR
jgi:hypothetical protein